MVYIASPSIGSDLVVGFSVLPLDSLDPLIGPLMLNLLIVHILLRVVRIEVLHFFIPVLIPRRVSIILPLRLLILLVVLLDRAELPFSQIFILVGPLRVILLLQILLIVALIEKHVVIITVRVSAIHIRIIVFIELRVVLVRIIFVRVII